MLAAVPYMSQYDSKELFFHEDDMHDEFETEHGDAESLAYRTVKRRRRLTQEETRILNNVFETTTKPNSQVRKRLAQQLGMTPRAVQIWFQNRRAKQKRDSTESANADTPPPKKLTFASDYYDTAMANNKANQDQQQRAGSTSSEASDTSRRSSLDDPSKPEVRRGSGSSSSPSPVTAVDEMEFSIFSSAAQCNSTNYTQPPAQQQTVQPMASVSMPNPRSSAPPSSITASSYPTMPENAPPEYHDMTSQMGNSLTYGMKMMPMDAPTVYRQMDANLPRQYGNRQCTYSNQGLGIIPSDMFEAELSSSPMTPDQLSMVFEQSDADYNTGFSVLGDPFVNDQMPLLLQGLPTTSAHPFNMPSSSPPEYDLTAPSPQLSTSSTTSNSEPASPQSNMSFSPSYSTLEHALSSSTRPPQLRMFDPSSSLNDFASPYQTDVTALYHVPTPQQPSNKRPLYRSKSMPQAPYINVSVSYPMVEMLSDENGFSAQHSELDFAHCYAQQQHYSHFDNDTARTPGGSSLSAMLQYL